MLLRLRQMLVKEFLQILRDPRMRMVVFAMPVLQMAVIAFALTTDVTHINLAVLDRDRSPSSRRVIEAFTAAGYFNHTISLDNETGIRRLLDNGTVSAALSIPAEFGSNLKAGRNAELQLIVDGTVSNNSAIILDYANQIISEYNGILRIKYLQRTRGSMLEIPFVEIEHRSWFNPNLESRFYYVPSMIAVVLMVVSMLLSSIAIVREKEIGTVEQIMVTPIRKIEFILGKTLPYWITGFITMTLMFIIAILIFGIRVNGSWFLLYVLAGVYLAGNLGIALLISTTAYTQQQALLTAFLVLTPNVLLSGFIFPVRNMPIIVQYIDWLNPMRWFLEIMHGIIAKGSGLDILWPAALAQTALALVFLCTASVKFRKTL
ncbi:MAG: ABC transporter permease [Verrucomicrobia bacterium]|nr:ABC transporter permease [Verrucomicrobiota bacterium]MCF7709062.1 ABC transporter permease [Verrucomicrobiota bacterium]